MAERGPKILKEKIKKKVCFARCVAGDKSPWGTDVSQGGFGMPDSGWCDLEAERIKNEEKKKRKKNVNAGIGPDRTENRLS